MVLGGLAGHPHVVGVDHAVLVVDGNELDPGVQGRRAELVGDHVLAAPATTADPGAVRIRRAIWFAMTPEGTNSAAGLPTRAAKVSSSARTVGSSP